MFLLTVKVTHICSLCARKGKRALQPLLSLILTNSLGQLQILSPIYRQWCLSTERIQTETWLFLSCVQLFVTPWTGVHQAPLSCTISWSLLKFMSIELVILSNHVILCHPPLLLPSVFPSIRVFSSESALNIQWPKYWSFASTTVLP